MLEDLIGRRAVQWHRSHLVVIATEEAAPLLGPLALGVGAGGDGHLAGANLAVCGADLTLLARRRVLVQRAAQALHRVREADRVGHRIDDASAAIEQRTGDLIGAAVIGTGGTGEQFDVRPTPLPLRLASA